MNLSQFHYDLPPERIAQEPVSPRDSSRLMLVSCADNSIAHARFSDLPPHLKSGDVVVLNQTRVFPARLRGQKRTGGKIEVLLLEKIDGESSEGACRWRALVRGSMKETMLLFPGKLQAFMEKRLTNGEWVLQFSVGDIRPFLEQYGEMPLPPYIKREAPRAADVYRYQTIVAQEEGAVAAPTAGFHFTSQVFENLAARQIDVLKVTLHVGWGTFRPVRVEDVTQHEMLAERYQVTSETAAALNKARQAGRRIVGVGTTVVRTLESVCSEKGVFDSGSGSTNLYITPGYRFKAIDALVTNFHLPDSTPILLASAFAAHKSGRWSPGNDPFTLRNAYTEALNNSYRFYSYGDAMLIQ